MKEEQQLTDVQLFEQLCQGDKAAFETIFTRYYQPLVFHCTKYVQDVEVGEEIVQDVFVKLWERRENIYSFVSVQSYLYTSVRNAALNHLKHLKIRDRYREHVEINHREGLDEQTDHIPDPDFYQRIEDAIESLPRQCRIVFRKSRFDGLKYHEIAEELGISIKTVEVHMSKALRLLREKLKDYLNR